MNYYDFTHNGGFLLEQDKLDFMQQAWLKALRGIAAMMGDGPAIVSGLKYSYDDAHLTYTVTPGWLWYNNDLVYCPGGTLSDGAIGAGQVLGFAVADVATPIAYYDGSNYAAQHVNSATWAVVSAAGGAGIIRYPADIVAYGSGFGANARESAYNDNILGADLGSIIGNLYCLKNYITNHIEYRMEFDCTDPTAFAAAPAGSAVVIGTLPVGYRPLVPQKLVCAITNDAGPFVAITGGGYLSSVVVTIGTDGVITATMPKTVSGTILKVYADGVYSLN